MMPSFQDIQEAVGFPEYFAQAERYAVSDPSSASGVRASLRASASSDSSSPALNQSVDSDTPGTSFQQPASAAGVGGQPSSMDPEPVQEARRQDVSDSSGLQAAAEEGQRAMEGKADNPEVMAEGQLSSLDDELRDLDADRSIPSSNSSAARESTPVVEPDAIVVSGTRKGGSHIGQAVISGQHPALRACGSLRVAMQNSQ